MKRANPVVIVSGGSKGLGLGIVKHLLNRGYFVGTFSRTKSQAIKTLQRGKYKSQFLWESVDGTDPQALHHFVRLVYEKKKKIDALINNAGVAVDGILTMMPDSDITKLLELNLHGTIRLTQYCINYMLKNRFGSIINISSIIGLRGYSGLSVYSATKAGLDGFTRALAREFGSRGIRINSVAPGYLYTDMSSGLTEAQQKQIIRRTPLGRLGKVDDVVGTVDFLLSPQAEFITGQTLVIDGGITC